MILQFYKQSFSLIRTKFFFKKKIKKLIKNNHKLQGRNNQGKITSKNKGGGNKKLYRIIDKFHNKYNILAKVIRIEYDPNRSTYIALINYSDGEYKYIICPEGLNIGDYIYSTNKPTSIKSYNIGNTYPLKYIPLSVKIHNIELFPEKGGQLVRAAGTSAQIVGKDKNYCIIQLPSNEIRLIKNECKATIGQLSNLQHNRKSIGKAGANRWLGKRPRVRGVAMNPIDHPHGGGEGKSPIGKKNPKTPWGKPTLGYRTRKKKVADKFIIKKRYGNL